LLITAPLFSIGREKYPNLSEKPPGTRPTRRARPFVLCETTCRDLLDDKRLAETCSTTWKLGFGAIVGLVGGKAL
jgi:hypothetical protein